MVQPFPGKKTLGALPWAAVQSGSQRGAFSSAGRRLLVVSSRIDPRAGPCPVSLQSPRRAGGCGASLVGGRYARWVGRGQLPNDLTPIRPRPGGDGSRGSMCLHPFGRTDTRPGRPGLGIRSSGAARLHPSADQGVGRGILSISLAVSGFWPCAMVGRVAVIETLGAVFMHREDSSSLSVGGRWLSS